jgi:hypothetical protein
LNGSNECVALERSFFNFSMSTTTMLPFLLVIC